MYTYVNELPDYVSDTNLLKLLFLLLRTDLQILYGCANLIFEKFR